MKEKIKDVKFWIALGSALVLIFSFLTDNFGIEQEGLVEVYSCVLALLTTLGVLTSDGKKKEQGVNELQQEIKQEILCDKESEEQKGDNEKK